MSATTWSVNDPLLVSLCATAALLALIFFICVFVADAQDARRRSQAKKAFRRARKHFAPDAPSAQGKKAH